MKKLTAALIVAAGLMASGAPAHAQAISIDAVVVACASPGASVEICLATQEQFVLGLEAAGLTPEEVDSEIGALVVALVDAAPPGSDIVAAALEAVALFVSSPAQADAILEVAAAVDAGIPVSPILIAEVASPA